MAMVVAWTLLTVAVVPASDATAGQKREGIVVLSNGKRVAGMLSLTTGKRLVVRRPDRKRPREVALSELAGIAVRVIGQCLIKEWRFKEEGSPVKVYTGRSYPRLDFGLTLTFTDGRALDCTVAKGTPLYVETGAAKRRRFIIPRYLTGEMGRKPEELIYLKSATFKTAESTPDGEQDGSKIAASALDNRGVSSERE